MTDLEWKLFVNNLKVGHNHKTNADYLHEMKTRIYLAFPDARVDESLSSCNSRMVHAVTVTCGQRVFGFTVELPLIGAWNSKA